MAKVVKSKSYFDVFEATSRKIGDNNANISTYERELSELNNSLYSEAEVKKKTKLETRIDDCKLANVEHSATLMMLANDAINAGLDEIIDEIHKLTDFIQKQEEYIDADLISRRIKKFDMESAFLIKQVFPLVSTESVAKPKTDIDTKNTDTGLAKTGYSVSVDEEEKPIRNTPLLLEETNPEDIEEADYEEDTDDDDDYDDDDDGDYDDEDE